MQLPVNPIELTVAGQSYDFSCRILAIVWVGATTSGDTVELRHQGGTIRRIWEARTSDTQTYLGLNLGPYGIHALNGFKLQQISAGRLYVYLSEA